MRYSGNYSADRVKEVTVGRLNSKISSCTVRVRHTVDLLTVDTGYLVIHSYSVARASALTIGCRVHYDI